MNFILSYKILYNLDEKRNLQMYYKQMIKWYRKMKVKNVIYTSVQKDIITLLPKN